MTPPLAAGRRRGVTLVEVLAAMVLMGIVLPAAMHGITIALRTAAHARRTTEAAQLAEATLNELLARRDPAALDAGGDGGPDRPEYRWESRAAAAEHGLYEVTVTVAWEEAARERSVALTTLVLPRSGGVP